MSYEDFDFALSLLVDSDGLVRFTTVCPRCHGPNEHAIEPEFVTLVRESGICERCVESSERAREIVE